MYGRHRTEITTEHRHHGRPRPIKSPCQYMPVRTHLRLMSSTAVTTSSGDDCATQYEGGGVDPVDQTQTHSGTSTNHPLDTKAQPTQQKSKRSICQGCNFPPRTCICSSLPSTPLSTLIQKCRIVVLRHPHELRRKNSSLPLVELCLFGKGYKQAHNESQKVSDTNNETSSQEEDFVMKTVVSRRFGEHCDSAVMKILRDPNEVVVLVFPHKQSMDLEEGIRLAEERCGSTHKIIEHNKISGNENENETTEGETIGGPSNAIDSKDERDTPPTKNTKRKKMTLIFIDATWKHAREMETKTDTLGEWPKNLIRVQLTPTALGGQVHDSGSSDQVDNGYNNNNADANSKLKDRNNEDSTFIERRFQIRAPPSPDHLSTAECVSWIVSRVERNPMIYQSIMNTLDFMVEIWKGFTNGKPGRSRVRGFTDGDGCIAGWDAMSQKKRKIK